MFESRVCAKCGSDKIIPRVRLMDRGHGSVDAGDLSLVVYEKPDALIFKGRSVGRLHARVCGSCGYVEMFVESPEELYQVYVASQEVISG